MLRGYRQNFHVYWGTPAAVLFTILKSFGGSYFWDTPLYSLAVIIRRKSAPTALQLLWESKGLMTSRDDSQHALIISPPECLCIFWWEFEFHFAADPTLVSCCAIGYCEKSISSTSRSSARISIEKDSSISTTWGLEAIAVEVGALNAPGGTSWPWKGYRWWSSGPYDSTRKAVTVGFDTSYSTWKSIWVVV